MVVFLPMRACDRGERVHQQLAFFCDCATASGLWHFKEVGQSLHLNHFLALNTSLPAKTLPGRMQLPFFSSFATVMVKGKADENGVLGQQ